MSTPSIPDARDALSRVLNGEEFAAAPRLQDFLRWVVEESVAGRASAISGKAIAIDVYGRDTADDESGLNLVRVEARRLRRRLERHYDGAGRDDPWHIVIDKGGYAPRFERIAPAAPSADSELPPPKRIRLLHVAAAVLVAAGILLFVEQQVRHIEEPESRRDAAERTAIGSRSMVSLQAVNLADQARSLLFPVFDIEQQKIALSMYRHVIQLDPGLHHGYSGAAQVLAVLAFLSPDAARSADLLDEAREMASAALQRAPTDPWAIAASGYLLAVSGSTADAMESARLAVDMAPADGHILDLAGMTAVIAGDGSFAAEVSQPGRTRSGVSRFGSNNIWGLSQYMTGNYTEAIRAFSGAAEAGASISAPSLVFLAVACDHAGNVEQAEEAIRELEKSWPSFPLEFVVGRIFEHRPEYATDIIDRINKYGYHARR